MKALFKGPRTIEGVTYEKGERELPDSLHSHWFFKALVRSGDVTLTEEPNVDVSLSSAEGATSHAPSATLITGQTVVIGPNGKPMLAKNSAEAAELSDDASVVESDHTITTEVELDGIAETESAPVAKAAEVREEDKAKHQNKHQNKGNAHNSHKNKGR